MKYTTLLAFVFLSLTLMSQKNWHLKDLKKDGNLGISLDKAYKLLQGRKSQPIVVAVIDGGIDTAHVDLKDVMWRNPQEKYNGIDDDGNGYVDDIFGWNFLGNAKGENIKDEAYELTRVYGRLKNKFAHKNEEDILPNEKAEYFLFKKVEKEFNEKYNEAYSNYQILLNNYLKYVNTINSLKRYFGKEELNTQEVRTLLRSEIDSLRILAGNYLSYLKNDLYYNYLENKLNEAKKTLFVDYNPDTNIRALVGDNPYDINDSIYGNNDVKGPSPSHGTFVAGIIAALRTNDNDCYGIADNVKIMALRVVPGGDERDKDIALAIRYAVRKGAKIINMSFGKPYSPEKEFVDDAIRFAHKHGVLLIHAAGNESENNDSIPRYPSVFDINNKKITDLWINVGASNNYPLESVVAYFSNYGKNTVDIFAPGVKIYSTAPNNSFNSSNGTSAAAPVVTGVAALLMSYFPELSASEIKDILMKSVFKKKIKTPVPSKQFLLSEDYLHNLCVSGGVLNAEKAVKMAIKITKKKR
ncbi:MAG: S8 family serine peptidase [Bacteroidales bacterium]|nr:S8 family serine peptidase [Bacteroidales bacterium]